MSVIEASVRREEIRLFMAEDGLEYETLHWMEYLSDGLGLCWWWSLVGTRCTLTQFSPLHKINSLIKLNLANQHTIIIRVRRIVSGTLEIT